MNEFNQIFAELVHPKRRLSERSLSSAVDTTDDSMTSSLPSNCCVDVDCVPHNPGYSNNAANSAIVDGCVASCSALTSNQLISASKCLSTTSSDDQCHEVDNNIEIHLGDLDMMNIHWNCGFIGLKTSTVINLFYVIISQVTSSGMHFHCQSWRHFSTFLSVRKVHTSLKLCINLFH